MRVGEEYSINITWVDVQFMQDMIILIFHSLRNVDRKRFTMQRIGIAQQFFADAFRLRREQPFHSCLDTLQGGAFFPGNFIQASDVR